jgi:hypothetical protein
VVNVPDRERWLRERVDAALVIGRWKSTTKEQLLLMLADALQHPGPQRTECSCPDLGAGRLDRNCPLHGVVAQDNSQEATPSADLGAAEEIELEDRVIKLRGYLARIHRLGNRQPSATTCSTSPRRSGGCDLRSSMFLHVPRT